MLFLKPEGKIDLDHRALFLRGLPGQSFVIAAAEDGQFSVISSDLSDIHQHRHPTKIRAVAPRPTRQRLALVDGISGCLLIQDFDGNLELEITPPQIGDGTPNWVKQGFEDCLFDAPGEFVWLAAPLNEEECEIQLLDAGAGSLIE